MPSSVKDIKEQDVYMGDMPLMTEQRYVRYQRDRAGDRLARCTAAPGVFFDHDRGKSHSSGKLLFAARIIPLPRLLARL